MNIYIDAMGGDNAPEEIIKGAVSAAAKYAVHITLVGDENTVAPLLKKYIRSGCDIDIIHAGEVIGMDEEPVSAIRRKKDSSMVIGADKVKGDASAAFISAGSTGALLAAALFVTGRLKGVQRPAMCTLIAAGSRPVALIDNGANADCKPEQLIQFAKMGCAYYTAVTGEKDPSVGLVNIGTEEIKGNQFYKEAHALLAADESLRFVGNIEGNALLRGKADVVVCDGFTGNVILKTLEGAFRFVMDMLKNIFYKNILSKLAAGVIKKDLQAKKSMLDPKAYGGVPFLGVNGLVIKAHGNSDAFAIENAVKQAKQLIEGKVLDKISETL